MKRRSHLRPPQPLHEPQPTDYTIIARALIFTSLATIALMLGLWATHG